MFAKLTRSFPIYPLLFSLYPVLALIAHNIGEVDPRVGLRSLLISAAVFVLVWCLLALLFHNLQKSALVTSVVCLLFFSYGQVYSAVQASSFQNIFGHHKVLVFLAGLILLAVVWFSLKKSDFNGITRAFNWISLFLVLTSIFPIIQYQFALKKEMSREQSTSDGNQLKAPGTPLPDVYYLILDSYTRADALSRDFDLDTSKFMDAMKARGFYVADCARSNYSFTELSMASAFNMNYVDQLNPDIKPGSHNLTLATALIKNNAVRRQFESLDYKKLLLLKLDKPGITGKMQTCSSQMRIAYLLQPRFNLLSIY
jgi:hypothetical protein